MKTLKKVLILCLLVVLSVTLLTACGEDGAPQDKEFTITYNLNADDAVFASPLEVKYLNGQKVNPPKNPTREGYVFLYWSDKEDLSTEYTGFGKWMSSDVKLYAKWGELATYTISYIRADNKDVMFTIGGENNVLRKDSVINSAQVNAGLVAYQNKHEEVFVNHKFSTKFMCGNPDGDNKIASTKDDVKVADYVNYADETGAIKFYIALSERVDEIVVYSRTQEIFKFEGRVQIVDGAEKGIINLKTAYRVVNGKRVGYDDSYFVLDTDGTRLMPKQEKFIEQGEIFNSWKVEFKDKSNTVATYNEKGELLTVSNKDGNVTPTDRFIDNDYTQIKKISMLSTTKTSQIKFYYYDANNDLVQIMDKKDSQKERVLDITFGYRILLNDFPTLEEFSDGSDFFKDKVIAKWQYKDAYIGTGVESTQEVKDEQIKDNLIEVVAVIKKETKQAKFETASTILGGRNQFFNASTDKTGVRTWLVEEIDAFLKVNAGDTSIDSSLYNPTDFNVIVGGMYEEIATINIPLIANGVRNENAELMANRAQATLVGFKYINTPDSKIIIKVVPDGNGGNKLVFNGERTTINPNDEKYVRLVPVFTHKQDNEVVIDTIGLIQENNAIAEGKTITGFKTSWGSKQVTPAKNSLDFALGTPTIPGYKFVKWVVQSSEFGADYAGVDFTSDYTVIGKTTIRPVFTIDEYVLTFVDAEGKDLFGETEKITGSLYTGKLNSDQIAKINAKRDQITSTNPEETFDDWYTEIDGKKVSFTEYSTTNDVDHNLTFKPEFKLISYDVEYRFIDINASQLAHKMVLLEQSKIEKEIFNSQGMIKGKTLFTYAPEALNYDVTIKVNGENTTETRNFVTGWYYVDSTGAKVTVSNSTAVNKSMVNEQGVITFYPILKEFEVTLEANGGTFSVRSAENNGVQVDSAKYGPVKGGAFGIAIENENEVTNLRYKGYKYIGYSIGENKVLRSEAVKDEFAKQSFFEDMPTRFTANTTVKVEWEVINHVVEIKYIGVDVVEGDVTLNDYNKVYTTANITGIYNPGNNKLVDVVSNIKDNAPKLIKVLAAKNKKPYPAYHFNFYELNDNKEKITFSNLSKVERDYKIYVEITYDNPAISMDANGGRYYLDKETKGNKILESHIVGSAVRNQNGTAYLSKTQEHAAYFTDQGAPKRDGYVFAGFSTNRVGDLIPNETPEAPLTYYTLKDILNGKIYYGYADHRDIGKGLFGNVISEANTCYLGDPNFVNIAIDNGLITAYNEEGNVLTKQDLDGNTLVYKVNIAKLYAVWVPVNVEVNYYKLYKETNPNGVKEDVLAGDYANFVGPEGTIVNPTFGVYGNNMRWALTPNGSFVDGKLIKDYVDYNILVESIYDSTKTDKLALITEGELCYKTVEGAGLKLYESLASGINQKYEIVGIGSTEILEIYDTFAALSGYKGTFTIKPEFSPSGYTGYVTRDTYLINGKPIDSIATKSAYQVKAFVHEVNGTLDVTGTPYYKVTLKAVKGQERIPMAIDVKYISGVEFSTIRHMFNDPLANPYYNQGTMATYETVTDEAGVQTQVLTDYNYFKGTKIKADVVNGNFKITRAAWNGTKFDAGTKKWTTSVRMDTYFNDQTLNKKVGNNVKFDLDGNNYRVENIDGTNFVIVTGEVYSTWVDLGVAKNNGADSTLDKAILHVDYVKTADAKDVLYTKDIVFSGAENGSTKYIGNKTPNEIKHFDKVTNPNPPTRRTWAVNGILVDTDAKQDGTITNSLTTSQVVQYVHIDEFKLKETGKYDIIINIKAIETWVAYYEPATQA